MWDPERRVNGPHPPYEPRADIGMCDAAIPRIVHVRPATPEDAPAVLALHRAAIRERGPTAYDDRAVAAWARRGDPDDYPIGDPDHEFLVAERDGAVAGFGDLALDEAEIVGVYVHPDHQRRGVGRALVERLESVARDRGHDALELVASLNAVGFYRVLGYERVRPERHETSDGVELDCVRMRARL